MVDLLNNTSNLLMNYSFYVTCELVFVYLECDQKKDKDAIGNNINSNRNDYDSLGLQSYAY